MVRISSDLDMGRSIYEVAANGRWILTYQLEEPFRLDVEFDDLNGCGYYKMDTLTSFIELFSINEKQTSGAFMFKTLLELVKDYCDGKKDFYQVVGYSKRV
jgi:hypothetical protein